MDQIHGSDLWIRSQLVRSKNMDPPLSRSEKIGSSRFVGSKRMVPRVFRVEKHGSARFPGRKTWERIFIPDLGARSENSTWNKHLKSDLKSNLKPDLKHDLKYHLHGATWNKICNQHNKPIRPQITYMEQGQTNIKNQKCENWDDLWNRCESNMKSMWN